MTVQRNCHAHRKLCRRGVRGACVYRQEREWRAPRAATLTLAEVLARAREQAPQIVSARLALEETRGRLLGASLRFQTNPEIDAGVGNRQGTGSRFTDFEIGLGQSFEPGSRRSARIAGANAAIAQGSADIDEITRVVLRSAAAAYYRAVHANRTHSTAGRDAGAGRRRVLGRPIADSRQATLRFWT